MIKVLIVDDHPIVREGIKKMLEKTSDISTAGEAENGPEMWKRLKENNYDVVLLDVSLPGRGGVEILEDLRRRKPGLPVLMLSMHDEEQFVIKALKAGAAGYVTKQSAPEELLVALRKVFQKGRYIASSLSGGVISYLQGDMNKLPHEKLSKREYEITCMIARGVATKKIAEALCLSANTVSTHRYRIMKKMRMKSIAQIIRYALQNHLID